MEGIVIEFFFFLSQFQGIDAISKKHQSNGNRKNAVSKNVYLALLIKVRILLSRRIQFLDEILTCS